MVKDTVIESFKTSPKLFDLDANCDIKMEKDSENHNQKNSETSNDYELNDKWHHESKKDNDTISSINISEQMGCNYEKDLKHGLVINTDKVGATRTEFYFETDHDALRGNPDYLAVLKTLAILEAQKVQAVKDLEILQDARKNAVSDPLTLVSKLQQGERLDLPGKQKIAQLPYINWDKYGLASLSQLATFSSNLYTFYLYLNKLKDHCG